MIVVSDTSPISNLLQIHRLNLLGQLYGQIIVPPAVDLEIKALKKFKIDIAEYEGNPSISVKSPFDNHSVNELINHIDIGESQAIVLAKELNADLLLIDERLGTRWAKESGLKTIGLIGTLILAKENDMIESVMPIIQELEDVAGFWLDDKFKSFIKSKIQE